MVRETLQNDSPVKKKVNIEGDLKCGLISLLRHFFVEGKKKALIT